MSLVRFRFWARRCSSMVEHQPSKLNTWVRFPSPALKMNIYLLCASGSVGGARPCQGRGRGFESRLALFLYTKGILKGYLLYINESCRTRTVRIFVLLRSVLTEVHWTSSTPSRAMQDSAGLECSRSPLCSGRCGAGL